MSTLLDISTLAGLRELSPEDPIGFLRELIESYSKQAQTDVAQLQIDGKAADWKAVAKSAHRLKSASLQIGVKRVGELAEAIEAITRPGVGDEAVVKMIETLKTTYNESETLLFDYLNIP